MLIEDDPDLNKNIQEALKAEGFDVTPVFDGLLAEKLLHRTPVDCVILDINLPGKSGYEVCKSFRNQNKSTPILMLTAFDELDDKIKGFECGADDYLTKPFFIRELLLRVASLLKRSENAQKDEKEIQFLVIDDLKIDIKNKSVYRQEKPIILTPREYQILLRLVKSKGELVPKKELIAEIWGKAFDSNTNTIEVYINFLRNKIDKPFGKQSIKTKVGYGYYFESN